MKFNMVCVKFDQKIKKLNFGLLRFFKNLKNLGFSKQFSSPPGPGLMDLVYVGTDEKPRKP